jgi:hypothetical protein
MEHVVTPAQSSRSAIVGLEIANSCGGFIEQTAGPLDVSEPFLGLGLAGECLRKARDGPGHRQPSRRAKRPDVPRHQTRCRVPLTAVQRAPVISSSARSAVASVAATASHAPANQQTAASRVLGWRPPRVVLPRITSFEKSQAVRVRGA